MLKYIRSQASHTIDAATADADLAQKIKSCLKNVIVRGTRKRSARK